jgi:fused signal recognition particle receptor
VANEQKPKGLFGRLKGALTRTREGLSNSLAGLFGASKKIDAALLQDIEVALLSADVGIEATDKIVNDLTARLKRSELKDSEAVLNALKDNMLAILEPVVQPLDPKTADGSTFVVLVVGINGAGKTTTIGKLAHRYVAEGRRVMLAAGDTFRAAAVEQLQTWAERTGTPIVAQQTGADSASVLYDALESARARGHDVLLADTAGRLHTHGGLMDELRKIKRVLAKQDANAPHEVLLVLDSTIGQNALTQAREFGSAVGVTGLVLTKLDGTARGGVVLSIAAQLGLPIRFIGVGEQVDDLRVFEAEPFIDAILTP